MIISHEPATGAELWRGPVGDIDAAVAHAQEAWVQWAEQPLAIRMELLRRFANEVRKQHEALTNVIARETGKPFWEARSEVDGVINRVEVAIRAYADRSAHRKLNSALKGTSAVRHKPHGVLAVIGPFNSPAILPCNHILPALVAGNAVIFKPSEKAHASGEMLINCFHAAGLPPAIIQMMIGGPETGKKMVAHPHIDGILFTGSAHNGITISRRMAAYPGKICALEMGGNNPLIVWNTPLIADAAVLVIQSAFTSAGQRCTAARRLIVKDAMYDQLMPEIKKLADRIIVGAPFDDPAPFMGPVIDNDTADHLTESFLYLMSNGGKPLRHMTRPNPDLPFLTPGIIDVTSMAEKPDIELFGPLLQVIRVETLDQAIKEANATRFGLSAGMVGGSPHDYNRFWNRSRAGLVNWNRSTNGYSTAMPLGGLGLSGNNRPSAYYAADYCAYPVASTEMEQPRAIVGTGFSEA